MLTMAEQRTLNSIQHCAILQSTVTLSRRDICEITRQLCTAYLIARATHIFLYTYGNDVTVSICHSDTSSPTKQNLDSQLSIKFRHYKLIFRSKTLPDAVTKTP